MDQAPVLAHPQAAALLQARAQGHTRVAVSLDLGLTTSDTRLSAAGIELPDGQRLTWAQVESIQANEVACFRVVASTPQPIQAFSAQSNRFYSLMPTAGAPTILIGGFPMHRIKASDPHQDTLQKLRAAGKLRGVVLDTCTGLGYTAIGAARTASQVVTIERDPTTLEIARQNPWSRALFTSPTIAQQIGDAAELVASFADGSFSRIIHDPPTFKLAGELYSGQFYQQLHRVLKQGGRLFHYIGSLESKSGSGVARGVLRRLHDAGFARIVRRPEAFGVVAYK